MNEQEVEASTKPRQFLLLTLLFKGPFMNRSGFTTSRLKTLDANHLNFPCIYKDGHMMTI